MDLLVSFLGGTSLPNHLNTSAFDRKHKFKLRHGTKKCKDGHLFLLIYNIYLQLQQQRKKQHKKKHWFSEWYNYRGVAPRARSHVLSPTPGMKGCKVKHVKWRPAWNCMPLFQSGWAPKQRAFIWIFDRDF